MNKIRMIMGCVLGMTMGVIAKEPAEQGERPPPPMRQERGGVMEGGEMMLLMRPMVVKQLELSAAQQSQIAAVVGSATNEAVSLRAKMQELAKKQAELMGGESIDEAAILKLADEIGEIRSEMAKIQIKQMLAARKILTTEQRLKMREMMKHHMEKRGGKGADHNLMRSGRRPAGGAPGEDAPDAPVPPPHKEAAPPPEAE